MNFILWATWALGVVIMALGVALVSARRPPSHVRWGISLFALGFVVMVAATSLILVAPVR